MDDLCDAEGLGVEGGLRDEAVGEGQAKNARDKGGEAEEEEVPVEAGGLFEGEFGALGDEGGDYMGLVRGRWEEIRGKDIPLWSNQKRMVNNRANGMAMKISPTGMSQK